MKDELIDAINEKTEQNRRFISVPAFCLICANLFFKLLIVPVKYLKLVILANVALVKNFSGTLVKQFF